MGIYFYTRTTKQKLNVTLRALLEPLCVPLALGPPHPGRRAPSLSGPVLQRFVFSVKAYQDSVMVQIV